MGGTGNWDGSDTDHWSASSGGADGASVPDWESLVKFDDNSFSADSQTVTITASAPIHSIDCLGVTHTPTFAGNPFFPLYGTTARFVAGMVFDAAPSVVFYPYADYSNLSCYLTTGGHEFALVQVLCGTAEGDDGRLYLQDDVNVVSNGYFHIQYGSLTTNNHAINCGIFYAEFYRNLSLGSSIITCNYGSGGAFALRAANDYTTPTIGTISHTGKFVVPLGHVSFQNWTEPVTDTVEIYNLEWGSVGSAGQTYQLIGDVIVHDLTLHAETTYQFVPDGVTITVNDILGNGGSGTEVVLQAGSSSFNVVKASGIIAVDYYNITDSLASGGATFYAGSHSIDGGGNTGWIFEDPPSGGLNIYVGAAQVQKIYIGSTEVTKVYIGGSQI